MRRVCICLVAAIMLIAAPVYALQKPAVNSKNILVREESVKETAKGGEFLRGLNKGRSFMPANSYEGMKMRRGLQHIEELYGPWCEYYCLYDYAFCISWIYFESRGDPWSKTNDNCEYESGIISVGYDTAAALDDLGMGGDPCGDPKWSVAAKCWNRRNRRRNMLEGECSSNKPACWSNWLPILFEFNRIEAEYFMGVAGSVNSSKIKKLVKISGVLVDEEHIWWQWILWVRSLSDAQLMRYLDPLEVDLWRFAFRVARSSYNAWNVRAGFFPDYCWGDKPYYFPQRYGIEIIQFPGQYERDEARLVVFVDDMPDALYPMPSFNNWRDRCIYYKYKLARSRRWYEPKWNDKYKKAACRDGVCWEKGDRKYPTYGDWEVAHAAWIDEMQEQRLLPSDEEYANRGQLLLEIGCTYQEAVPDEKWEEAVARENRRKKRRKICGN